MPEAGSPIVGPQYDTPLPSRGFGPAEAMDARRQAQFGDTADTPADVNMNAAAARSQFMSVDQAGKNFITNQDFRDKIASKILDKAMG